MSPGETSAPARIRSFLAVNLPVAVVRRIGDEVAALRSAAEAAGWRIAWVPPPNLHVTVKFLGLIDPHAVEALAARLSTVLAARPPFELLTSGVGVFPDAEAPRVLWVGVRPSTDLVALQQLVETTCEELGFGREPRPFHPHLTIGRVKAAGAVGSFAALLDPRREIGFGGGRIQELAIYESPLPRSDESPLPRSGDGRGARSGQEYKALARLLLGRSERSI